MEQQFKNLIDGLISEREEFISFVKGIKNHFGEIGMTAETDIKDYFSQHQGSAIDTVYTLLWMYEKKFLKREEVLLIRSLIPEKYEEKDENSGFSNLVNQKVAEIENQKENQKESPLNIIGSMNSSVTDIYEFFVLQLVSFLQYNLCLDDGNYNTFPN